MAAFPTSWVIPLNQLSAADTNRVGAKAAALAELMRRHIPVPDGLCLTADVYDAFVDVTGMRERIMLELHRKNFTDMRWEEIWDCATRIRWQFLNQPMPAKLQNTLMDALDHHFGSSAVAVRSSAPEEDTSQASFAGLHASYINVHGANDILEHIRKVWASLWSDAALLYRQELGLTVEKSAMAVIVQAVAIGDSSGVVFSQHPLNAEHCLIESVHGLNQGLVDGQIEPDRWEVARQTGRIVSHTPADRKRWVAADNNGLKTIPLPQSRAVNPPLTVDQVQAVFDLSIRLEAIFGCPQDVEWTLVDGKPVVVQSRPITTAGQADPEGDPRSWYLSLHRSFDNLTALAEKIENRWLPDMVRTAAELHAIDLTDLAHKDLAAEIERRWQLNQHWTNVYWADFIPFAHGVRLFGHIYNDTVKPENPYEFVDLLADTPMQSVERNRHLERLADRVRRDPELAERLTAGLVDAPLSGPFAADLNAFVRAYGDLSCGVTGANACQEGLATLIHTILEMAKRPPQTVVPKARSDKLTQMQTTFIRRFPPHEQETARKLIDLARRSYQLRDDDNIYLGRIEAQYIAALQEGRRRLHTVDAPAPENADRTQLEGVLHKFDPPGRSDAGKLPLQPRQPDLDIRPRQLTGQPASPGIASGDARIVKSPQDFTSFLAGEILVCDAIDPNMTFLIPLAAAIVERRGGMLIHGAIIAREYGLPCITGVPAAIDRIQNGDRLTVDGYLGIVTVGRVAADKHIDND